MKPNPPGILFLAALFCCVSVWAQPQPGVQQYACNRAAVVMIKTSIKAEVYVPGVVLHERALNHLLDSVKQLEADSIHLTPAQQLDIVLQAFHHEPRRYFISNFNYFRHIEKVTATGSGFIISPEGRVLTNCHVVDEGDAYIKRRFIQSAFNYVSQNNIKAIEQAWAIRFTEEQRKLLDQTFASIYSQVVPIEMEKMEKTIDVILNRETSSGEPLAVAYPAKILRKGRSMPGKDIAILQIHATGIFPSMPLADNAATPVGSDVYVYGFPNPVNTNEFLSEQTVSEPTLTRGILSGWKQSSQGWPVMQMDAAINHGNSGGPVCNAAGQVIGVATFGSMDDNVRSLAPGLNFAIPMQVVKEFFDDSIRAQTSPVSAAWCNALELMEQKLYKKAMEQLAIVKANYPDHPGLYKMISICNAAIQQGRDNGSVATWAYFVGALIVLLFAAIVYGKIRRSKF